VIDEEARDVLCRAVCEWAGVPANDEAVATLARDVGEMVDGAGHVGPQNWRAQVRRTHTEARMRRLIEEVRRGRMAPPEQSALHTIARHRELDGRLLPVRTAAVELINVLRPTVAVGRFVTFVALALHDHPYCRWQLMNGRREYCDWFVQEVRRFYPFFPAIGGRAQYDFDWNGRTFRKGDWVLLDVYGTNHDARIWHDPEVFRPERHSGGDASGPRLVTAFDLIPQGGGNVREGHRCPGEPITIELMKVAARFLASLDYDVPPQDLSVNLAEMPARPASGFVIANPRLAA